MSVYEYLTVENKKIYSKEEILLHFLDFGCIKYPEDSEYYKEAEAKGVIKSNEFINMDNSIIRVPFYLPVLRESKKYNVYDVASCNHVPLPLVAFEWVRKYFPEDTMILWEVETTKLFRGKIINYFKTRKIKKNWLEKNKEDIEMRKGLHKLYEKQIQNAR